MVQDLQRISELPFPSTALDALSLLDRDGDVVLRLEYDQGDGDAGVWEFRFEQVRAYRHRAESHCRVWHLEAYDQVVEVENSVWVGELLDDTPADLRGQFEMHHYMVYVDSYGCYEVVAASCSTTLSRHEGES